MKKRYLVLALCFAFIIGLTGISYADHTSTGQGDNAGGISGSRHNVSSSGSHYTSSNTSEICVFCHTPHHARQTAGPLWNRGDTGGFTPYNGDILGAMHTGGVPGYGTLACLSCHDGVTTFDNLVNAPGKGMGSGGALAGDGEILTRNTTSNAGLGWDFTEGGTAISDFLTSARLTIGKDLRDDHPVSMAYEGSNHANERPVGSVLGMIDLRIEHEDGSTIDTWMATNGGATSGFAGNSNFWAVNGMITSMKTITDILRGNTTFADEREYVQCTSCHDPHYKNQTNDEAQFVASYGAATHTDGPIDGLFLRRVGGNTDSGVCRTCHNK